MIAYMMTSPYGLTIDMVPQYVVLPKAAPREALKLGTKSWHKSVERDTQMKRLMAADLAPSEYLQILQKLYQLHVGIEAKLKCGGAELHRLPLIERSATLARDILAMGGLLPVSKQNFAEHLMVATVAETIGVMYVVEGSVLGGQIIAKRLSSSNNNSKRRDKFSVQFFSSCNDNVMSRWNEFCMCADTNLSEQGQIENAVAAANATFSVFHQALN